MGARDLQVNGAARPNQPDGCAGWLRWERLKNWGRALMDQALARIQDISGARRIGSTWNPLAWIQGCMYLPRSAGVQGPENAALFHVELLHSLAGAPGRTSHSLAPTRPRRNGCTRAGHRSAEGVPRGTWGRARLDRRRSRGYCTTSSAWLECYFAGSAAPMRPGLHMLPRGPSEALHV